MTDRPISILLIEDEHDFAVAFEAILGEIKSERYDLECVDTFELARKMISARRHDVYVVDYVLGHGDGLELIREATSCGHPGPFIVLTARGNREVDQRAMDAGAADYLDKSLVGKFAFTEGSDVNPGADLLERSIRYAMERARARAELKASETQFRNLIEGSIQGICVHRDGKALFANDSMARILGFDSAEEILNLDSLLGLFPPKSHKEHQARWQSSLSGASPPQGTEIEGIRKDGSVFWIEAMSTVVDWQCEPAIQSACFDITHRKQVESELQANEERLRLVTGQVPGMIYRRVAQSDGSSVFTYISPHAEKLTGYTAEEILADAHLILDRYHPDDLARISAQHDQEFEAKTDTLGIVAFRYRHKAGHYIWLRARYRRKYHEDGSYEVTGIWSDISEQKKVEEQLRESQERFYQMAENIPATVFEFVRTVDGSYRVPYVNRIGAGYMFLTSDELETLPASAAPIFERMHPDERDSFLEALEKSHRSMTRFDWQGRSKHASGDWRWVHGFASPRKLENGDVMWNGVILDIHKHRQDQEALRQSEERFRDLIDGSIQGILVQRDFEILFVNQSYCDIFGYDDPQELLELGDLTKLISPGKRSFMRAIYEARMRGEPTVTDYETEALKKDGTPVTVRNLVRVVDWNGEPAAQTVCIDITARKQAEEELLLGNRIVENLAEGVVLFSASDGKLVFTNPRFDEMFGYDRGELIGQHASVLNAPGEKSPQVVAENIFARLEQAGELDLEVQNVRKDGSLFWCRIHLSKGHHPQHGAVWISVREDITERKQAEQQLVAANQAKSRFLSHMSHELRTPLNAILGFTQLLKRDPSLSEEHLNDMRIIHSSGEHLLELINDVLDISKIEAGLEVVQIEDFDLYRNLDGLMDMFSVRASDKGLTLELDVHADVPQFVRGDRRKVRQVLINLIGNAIKFTDQGGVRLDVSRGAEGIRFKVKDTGAGISDEDLNRIFEPFHQAGRTAAAGGTGLGLPISKNFVELMGGQLTVDSRENEGSVFAFSLPLKPLGEETAPVQDDQKTITGLADHREWRILIVDDDPVNRKFLRNLLERTGFTTQEAENGSQAIKQFEEFSPHLILMDIRMPVMDGMEAARRIREMENSGRIAIIALTANAFVRNESELIQAGCDRVISKPFDAGNLLLSVGRMLRIEFTYDEPRADKLAG